MQLTGNLGDLGLGEIFQILSFSRKSGVLRLRNTRMEGLIVFKEGSVIKAASSVLKEDVGEALLKAGRISREKLEDARRIQKESLYAQTLGAILAQELKVLPEDVEGAASRLIEKAVHLLFFWQDGYFVFELGDYSETSDIIKSDALQYTLEKGLNTQSLAMEGLKLLDESKKTEKPPIGNAGGKEPFPQTAGPAQDADALAREAAVEAGSYVESLLNEIGDWGFPDAGAEVLHSVTNSKGLLLLKEMLEELARPVSLNEIILLILRFSSEITNRSVIFMVKNGQSVGFGQSGIEIEDDIPDDRVRDMSIPVGEQSILSEAITKKKIVAKELERTPWNEYIVERLGGQRPIEAFAAPVIVQDRVAMLLYGDNVPESKVLDSLSTLDIFLAQTSIAMERLILKENSQR